MDERDSAEQAQPVEVIRIIFTEEDVLGIARDKGIPEDVALDRAHSWGKHIADTMTQYAGEQLESVVEFDQP